MKSFLLHYGWGLLAQTFNGVWQTLAVLLGVSGGTAIFTDVTLPSWHTILSALIGAVVINAVFYFKAHPLPSDLPNQGSFTTALNSVIKT
jgi:Na+-transporting NADH:ubiquinone oxidoreductase subunit NqrB